MFWSNTTQYMYIQHIPRVIRCRISQKIDLSLILSLESEEKLQLQGLGVEQQPDSKSTHIFFLPTTYTYTRTSRDCATMGSLHTHTPPHHVFPPETIITTETLAETGLQNTLRKPKNSLDNMEQPLANTQIPQILEPHKPRSHYAHTILSTIPFP
jgi:hypothetical protein